MFVLGFGFEMGVVGLRNQVDVFFTVVVAIYIIRLIFFRTYVLLLTRWLIILRKSAIGQSFVVSFAFLDGFKLF